MTFKRNKMVVVPIFPTLILYPSPLFEECKENGQLLTEDWDRYDMREQIMSSPVSGEDIKELTQMLYKSFISPQFFLRKVLSIRGADDLRFFWRAGKKIIGHLTDFKAGERHC